MFKRYFLLVALCLLVGCAKQETVSKVGVGEGGLKHLIVKDDINQWEGMAKPVSDIKHSGDSSFELYGKYTTELRSKKIFPVDVKRAYALSAWFRTRDKSLPASAFMGLHLYDKNMHPIKYNNVSVHADTASQLIDAVKIGDTSIRVSKSPRWLSIENKSVAFDVDDNYQDLPNFHLSSKVLTVVEKKDHYLVTLRSGLTEPWTAGTTLRLHSPWGAPFYWVAKGWMPVKWKEFAVRITGESKSGTPKEIFWKGTRYVRPFVWFGNYDKMPKKGARLLVDDISFTSEPIKATEILGHVSFSRQWHVFGPMTEDDEIGEGKVRLAVEKGNEIAIGKKTFPKKIIKTENYKLDFRKIYTTFPVKSVAYACTDFDVSADGDVTFGLGADWWMQAWVDGRLLCDTRATGNGKWPPTITDHKRIMRLKKGKHTLVVRFISGSGSSVLAVAGPDQLRLLKNP